jgi:[protein-PII] uridylyltransferase
VNAQSLKDARAALLTDSALRGRAYGQSLAAAIDDGLRSVAAAGAVPPRVALVALGSYARGELCPGSDVDVLVLYDGRGKHRDSVRRFAERCWYLLWDAGFVTGHGLRTVKESLALAGDDLDALTSFLDARHVFGDAGVTDTLVAKGRELAVRRSRGLLSRLADSSESRRTRPGLVSERLEPDVKDGGGGLRDLHALAWAGYALGGDALRGLVTRGYVSSDDAVRLSSAGERLLDVRVALHRVTGGRSDRLALQEQTAVAVSLGLADADVLMREVSSVGRDIAWIVHDVWLRIRDHLAGPAGRVARREQVLAEGVVLREGRVVITDDAPVSALRLLEAAAAAAEADAPFERATLARLGTMSEPTWDVWERAAFLRLLRAGVGAIPVFEALDHERVLVRLLPEWERVRSRPQRNAYHRFTVDRHLLEAVAKCASLLDAGDAPDGDFEAVVARACRRPELLLLGALLHDIGKGMVDDHSTIGAEVAGRIVRRIGLDSEGREIVVWLVRNHLLMADIAMRRDLADASVADRFAAACSGDGERLRLLYLLTIGDSQATGPAAWGTAKASLLRDLFVKAAAAIERGESATIAADRRAALVQQFGVEAAAAHLARLPDSYLLAFDVSDMVEHAKLLQDAPAVRFDPDDDRVRVTVAAADRPGLLATLAGALTVSGLDVIEANLFVTTDGLALDVFSATDPYGRLDDGVARVEGILHDALRGTLDVAARVAERTRDYQRRRVEPGAVAVDVDAGSSATDTLVEVHADDELGLLYRVATTFAELGLDVRVAKVTTLGSRVVDAFSVRLPTGEKLDDPDAIEALRAALVRRLTGSLTSQ